MARVFNHLRCINYASAAEAVDYFVHADFEALREYLSTIIYFAELAEDFNEEEKLKFKDVLFRLIETDAEAKSTIAWHMWSLSNAKSSSDESYLNKTFKYIHKIVEKYDQDAFRSVYSLINDHFNNANHQQKLLSICKECIRNEFEYLSTHPEYPNKVWAPYYRNSEILKTIFGLSKKDFLHIFKVLSQYAPECDIGDIRNIVDLLFELPRSQQQDVADIFENLVDRYPTLHEKKKQWEAASKGHD
jgi:hypothetical protein